MNHAARIHLLGLGIAIALGTGCGRSGQEQSPTTPSAAGTATAPAVSGHATPDARDPCRLLQPAEVEAVLGAALAGPPYRAAPHSGSNPGVPSPDGKACWYVAADFRNLVVEPTWTGASSIFQALGAFQGAVDSKLKGSLKLQDGSLLTGEWDEARVVGGTNFMALRGDSLVEVDFGGSLATEAQAAMLADAALLRLEKPLAVDGTAGAAAALAHERQRPTPKAACQLLTKQDVEQLLGPVSTQEAEGDTGDICNYTYLDPAGKKKYLQIRVDDWRDGYREYRGNHNALQSAAAIGASGGDLDAGEKRTITRSLSATALPPGPWDAAASSIHGVTSVKRDVQMTLDPPAKTDPELLRRLMTRAYERAGLLPGPSK